MTASTTEETPATTTADIEEILPSPGEYSIRAEGGRVIRVNVKRLRTREFLMLMRAVTGGLGSAMAAIRVNTTDEDQMVSDLISIFMLAIPNSIDEFAAFLLSIVEAKDRSEQGDLAREMQNPEIEVLMDLVGLVIEQEKDDLSVLMGKATAWLAKTKQVLTKTSGPTA